MDYDTLILILRTMQRIDFCTLLSTLPLIPLSRQRQPYTQQSKIQREERGWIAD